VGCESVERRSKGSFAPVAVPRSEKNGNECEDEYGGVEVGQKERLCIGFVGENSLKWSVSIVKIWGLGMTGIHFQESSRLSTRRRRGARGSDPMCAAQHRRPASSFDWIQFRSNRRVE
jgi:hypothetical protein